MCGFCMWVEQAPGGFVTIRSTPGSFVFNLHIQNIKLCYRPTGSHKFKIYSTSVHIYSVLFGKVKKQDRHS